ncbi:hypothetical protein SAMN06265339_1005 [Desulfurobacterium pacificum]|uniref:Lipoprotein n=1 Tax=Desulfurobacterium pacificum TaxID=240166 RepID=A0ABY1NN95_9BACT|nr:hypothetical protein SAMN06265339_1005 [Desulfurobacterium pacificum]
MTLLAGLLTIFSFSCATCKDDCTITYPAALIANHPDGFYGYYVKLVGILTYKKVQDQFPPFAADDPLLCDKSGCIYVHDDTEDLGKFIGKKVRVLGYVSISRFYFPYIDVVKIEPVKD